MEVEGVEKQKQTWKEGRHSEGIQPRQHGVSHTRATQWGTDMVDRDRETVAQPDLSSSEKGASSSLAVHSAPNSRVKGDLGWRVCIKPPNPKFPKNRKRDTGGAGRFSSKEDCRELTFLFNLPGTSWAKGQCLWE